MLPNNLIDRAVIGFLCLVSEFKEQRGIGAHESLRDYMRHEHLAMVTALETATQVRLAAAERAMGGRLMSADEQTEIITSTATLMRDVCILCGIHDIPISHIPLRREAHEPHPEPVVGVAVRGETRSHCRQRGAVNFYFGAQQ